TYDRTATDSVTVNLPTTIAFQYDGNGNLTNDGRRVFEYDYENQLTNVSVADEWRTELKYDAFGRLRVRREYAATPPELVTSVNLGTLRNNHAGWVGFRLLVGSTPVTV